MPRDQKRIIGTEVSCVEVVEDAIEDRCASISYTYTEPTIFFEYAMDVARLAQEKGLRNIFVTNGYMTRECIDEMKGTLDAANVDVKSFSESFYRKICGAKLKPVLESVEYMRELGIWVEVTTLIIPTLNDSPEELREIARWIAATDKSIPWHISAFYPAYKLDTLEPTPPSTIERAREIGLSEGLRYVYTGNLPGLKGESTFCYSCGKELISRYGFTVKRNVVVAGKCPHCHAEIDGVGL
jgi:pyruvate formate lyase activating enzyme